MLKLVTSMLNARFQDRELVAQTGDGFAELARELGKVPTTPVAQLDPLEGAPDPLDWIGVGRITRQGFEMKTRGSPLRQEILDHLAAMNRRAIPDHQDLTRDVTQEVAEKPHDIRPFERAAQHVLEDPPLPGQATDRREVIAGERDPQERGVSPGRIGPDSGGEEVETGFVNPDDGAPFGVGFFSRTGQRSVSQASTLAGSRWVARTSGCWTLSPRVRTR